MRGGPSGRHPADPNWGNRAWLGGESSRASEGGTWCQCLWETCLTTLPLLCGWREPPMAAPLLLCTSLLLHVHITLWHLLSPGGVAKEGVPAAGCVWRGPFCLGSGRGRTEAHAAFLFGPFRCKALLSWAELPQGSLPWPAGGSPAGSGSGAGSSSSIFGGQYRVRGVQVWPHTQAQTSVLSPSEL